MKEQVAEKHYPKITIVATCYNREQFIAETIESVLSQNYPNLEFIVIDDNSTDRSWEIIQSYKDRLAYIEKLPGNRTSPIYAINYALSKSTGEYMTTLNDKNVLIGKSLFTAAEVFSALPELEWITGIGLLVNSTGIVTSVMPIRKDFYDHLRYVPWNIQHESTFWSRSLWERTGSKFDEEYPWAFDAGLWCKFFATAKLYHLNTIIGAYRKTSLSHSFQNMEEYNRYARKARELLRSKQSKVTLALAEVYRVLWYLKPILRNIPDKAYARIPLLNVFCNNAIRFTEHGGYDPKPVLYKRNPFRTIYPW